MRSHLHKLGVVIVRFAKSDYECDYFLSVHYDLSVSDPLNNFDDRLLETTITLIVFS